MEALFSRSRAKKKPHQFLLTHIVIEELYSEKQEKRELIKEGGYKPGQMHLLLNE